jgi:hypothetical protein
MSSQRILFDDDIYVSGSRLALAEVFPDSKIVHALSA